ncbi:MAG TPA: hypothetical protein VF796_28360 [Humisphaera sp.]
MVIDPLLKILKTPSAPRETGTARGWGDVGYRLGEVLPGDYMKFIELYGTGTIAGWLTVFNPFAANPHQNLLVDGFVVLGALREIKREYPDQVPFPLFYEPDGLLPWGISIDGDIFCWSTTGLSGNWTVVVIGRHTGNEAFAMPMTRFLFEALSRKIEPRCFPPDLDIVFDGGRADDR